MSETFFISDTHFGHRNILSFCDRPWSTVDDMNEGLIDLWNETVKPGDVVYHLGDFSFIKGTPKNKDIFDRLNGQKFLVLGNHDYKHIRDLPWVKTFEQKRMNIDGVDVILNHYPLLDWNRKMHGAVHLYGHVHGRIPHTKVCMDVGMDYTKIYRPVTWGEIKEFLDSGADSLMMDMAKYGTRE